MKEGLAGSGKGDPLTVLLTIQRCRRRSFVQQLTTVNPGHPHCRFEGRWEGSTEWTRLPFKTLLMEPRRTPNLSVKCNVTTPLPMCLSKPQYTPPCNLQVPLSNTPHSACRPTPTCRSTIRHSP